MQSDSSLEVKTILFASTNKGKLAEVQKLAAPYGIEIASPLSMTSTLGTPPIVIEGDSSYFENARRKAVALYNWARVPTLSDDAGLEVDALNGMPGVQSACFAGEGAGDAQNLQKLLQEIKGKDLRTARFRSVLCYIDTDAQCRTAEAVLEGRIVDTPSGTGGFGYDPVFEVDGFGETLSKLKEHFQPKTHRAKAFEILMRELGYQAS